MNSELGESALGATVSPENTTNKTLAWESSAPEICRVEDGKLIRKKEGTATLRATLEHTSVQATVTVCVMEDHNLSPVIKVAYGSNTYGYYLVLQEDGSPWLVDKYYNNARKLTLKTKEGQILKPVDVAVTSDR